MYPEKRAAPASKSGIDEIDAIRRVAQGDKRAFELLYRCYFRRLTRFLDPITRRPQLTEEILDDTMVVVWHKAASFNGASSLSTWIFAIAHNKAMKALKREKRLSEVPYEADETRESPSPEGDFIEVQTRTGLQHFLAALSAEQRAVVELTYYYGHAYGEIAEIVGCPVDTVKTRMFHARRKLKAMLLKHGKDAL